MKRSKLADKYLLGLKGIEIGGSAHNAFGLNTLNIDRTDEMTVFKQKEVELCGTFLKVDVVAYGDELPFKNGEYDFVISSHVIEHFYNPINAIKEWLRVVKPGGYVFMIIPHKERTFDRNREVTSLEEIIKRKDDINKDKPDTHHCVYTTESFLEICNYLNLNVIEVHDVDDKVGNGFTILIKK